MKFKVFVEKRLYCTGTVTVDCDSPKKALDMVESQIINGTLQTSDVKDWGDEEYEDCSFGITGDVD